MAAETCADRISSHLHGRLNDFWNIQQRVRSFDNDVVEDALNEIDHLPLSIEKKIMVKILLSTGGPADWFECYLDSDDGSVYRIEYHFQDWFDHASVELDGEDYNIALDFLNAYLEVMQYHG